MFKKVLIVTANMDFTNHAPSGNFQEFSNNSAMLQLIYWNKARMHALTSYEIQKRSLIYL